jgi:hypothetical protein
MADSSENIPFDLDLYSILAICRGFSYLRIGIGPALPRCS